MAARPLVLVAMVVLTLVDTRDIKHVWNVWSLTESEPSVQFELNAKEEEVSILATGQAIIRMMGDGMILGFLCSDAQGQPTLEKFVENCTDPTLKLFHPLKLDIKLENRNSEILANGVKLNGLFSNADPGTLRLTLVAQFHNSTGSVYVAHHLPSPPGLPKPQNAIASYRVVWLTALLVVFATMFFVAVVVIVLLLRRLPPASIPVWVPRRLVAAQLQEVDLKQLDTVAQGAGGDLDDTEPLPHPPRRPTKTFAEPPVTPKGNYILKNDPEYDYIMANDVKPVEVEILKQQKVIDGDVYHTSSLLPSSASCGTSPPLVSCQNSVGSHSSTVSPQNPVEDFHPLAYNANTNKFSHKNDYAYIRAPGGVGQASMARLEPGRMHPQIVESNVYDDLDNTNSRPFYS